MDKRNRLASYVESENGGGGGRGSAPQSRNNRHGNSATSRGGGRRHGDVNGSVESLDAVANYQNYSRNKPSNPLSLSPRRHDGGRDGGGNNGEASHVHRSTLREQQRQQREREQQPARLTYYNEGESPSGGGGFKETPRTHTPGSGTRASTQQQGRRHSPGNRRGYQPDYTYTNATQINRNADLVDSRPQSARVRPSRSAVEEAPASGHSSRRARERPSGLVVTPAAHEEEPVGDNGSFDDYVSPSKRTNGRYDVGDGAAADETRDDDDGRTQSSLPVAASSQRSGSRAGKRRTANRNRPVPRATTGPAEFLVRIHRVRDAFADFEEAQKPAPTTFMSLHTTEERGRTGVVAKDYNPTFNDEFLFTSSQPDKDALVVTLVAAAAPSQYPNRRQSSARDKRVAEAILSLQNLADGVERERWVTLVRHPGTAQAYECGEVLVSMVTEQYGQDALPTEEEEAVYYDEVHDILVAHAPEELHRLDWFVGNVAREGPEGLARLRGKMLERAVEPVTVRLTIAEVSDLTAADGRPSEAETCYVAITTRKGGEARTKTVLYRRRAAIDQTFAVTIRNPEADAVSLSVFSAGRKLGEAQVGLANVQAGVEKEVSLMLVRAAETGDATPAGAIRVILQTDGFSSPYQMSASREARLRERVMAYLWSYLRDDLHRLDAIVAGIDDEDAYMAEWARTIGPEKKPKHASLRIRGVKEVYGAGSMGGGKTTGVPPRVFMRVVVGPTVYRTESASVRNGEVSFKSTLDVVVYDPKTDSMELMLIEEGESADTEISRVVLGAAGLPHGEAVVRPVKLVSNALGRSAQVQGEAEVELIAHDFGLPLDAAVVDESQYRYLCERMQGVTARNNPEALHRVPYMIDTAPPGKAEETVAKKAKEFGQNDVAAAPMTVRILGLRGFRKKSDCYVKAFLDGNAILRTRDKRGATEITFDIADDNEVTVKLDNANQSRLVFKIAQHHSCLNSTVVARTELALRGMVRGERNTVWIPLFEGSEDQFHPVDSEGGGSTGRKNSSSSAGFRGSRMPTARSGNHGTEAPADARPLGLLGVMVKSNAFTGNTVTEYDLGAGSGANSADNGEEASGARGGRTRARGGGDERNGATSAYEAVTRDVTSLLMKYQPQALTRMHPLIAECSSLKEAHNELRSRFAPRPIAATVYIHIDKVELATPEGRAQEEQCGVRADISYGDEHGSSIKKREFEDDVIHQRILYTPVRLDIPSSADGPTGTSKQLKRGRDALMSAPPLEIKLVGVRPGREGKEDRSRGSFRSRSSGCNERGRTSATLSPERHPQWGGGGSGGSAGADAEGGGDSANPRRSIGGPNNLNNYLDESTAAALHPPQDTAASDSPYAYHYNGEEGAAHGTSSHGSGSRRGGGSPSRARGRAANGSRPSGAMALQGEMGFVQLSLRALVSAPIHQLRDAIRVPIIRPPQSTSFGSSNRRHTMQHGHHVIGHVTLRVSLPAFATVPEPLRLASRAVLAEVEPKYVHYYERRIGAYLRENSPADLVDFHYKLFERDVAAGRWPTALYDWLQALIKRFGPETTNTYGPEPPLPFDPEERERLRQEVAERFRPREAAFADSASASGAAATHPGGWLGEDSFYNDSGAAYSPANDIYEVKEQPIRRTGKASHKAASLASSQSRGVSHTSQTTSTRARKQRSTSKDAASKREKKGGAEVYGF